jgi:hypothetical protein
MRPGEPAAQVVRHQLGVFGRDQVGEPAIDEIHAIGADETGELAVGVQDDVAMHQHRFVDALAQFGEKFGTGTLAPRVARSSQQ